MCLCTYAGKEEYPQPKWICFYFPLKPGNPPVHPLKSQSTCVIEVEFMTK
jgi:hypothetical protein